VLLVLVAGLALTLGRRADRWSVAALLAACFVMAYLTYAVVFYPIRAGIQGRHLLPLVVVATVLAGAAVTDRLEGSDLRSVVPRLLGTLGCLAGGIQAFAVYWNARRYAVGIDGPLNFSGQSEWSPPGGWIPWLILAAAGGIMLAASAVRNGAQGPIEVVEPASPFRPAEEMPRV